MATWTTDIAGTGLAKHQPTVEERRRARVIARRWAMWQPVILYDLRQRQRDIVVITELARLRQVHTAAMSRLLNLGVPLRHINKNRKQMLDDPRITEPERDRIVREVFRASEAQWRLKDRHAHAKG